MSYRIAQEDEPSGPWEHFARVLQYPELAVQANLANLGINFAFMFREHADDWNRNGKRILGMAMVPGVTGQLRDLFEQLLEDAVGYWPDFLIMLNAAWWEDASDREREILIFHELKHCGQALDAFGSPKFRKTDGGPVLAMVAHDVEEFADVVARYGAWKSDLRDFLAAAERGPRLPNFEVMRTPDLGEVMADLARAPACDILSERDSQDDVF